MATPARPVHIPAGLPIDEATRLELLPMGQANVQNRNVRNYETGALEKRLGTRSMSLGRLDGATRQSGLRLIAHAENPCVVDKDANFDQYSTTLDAWSSTGPIPEANYKLRPLPSPTADCNVFDSAAVNGMIAVAYGRSGDSAAIMAVFDETDGSVISPLTIIGAGPNFDRGFHAVGSIKDRYFIAVTTSFLDTEIRAYKFDTQNIASGWVSIGTIETDLAIAYPSICSLDDRVIVAYAVSSGTSRVTVKAVNESGVIDSTTALTSSGTPTLVDVDGRSSDVVWLTFDLGVNLRVIALSPTSLSTVVGSVLNIWSTIANDVQGLRICVGNTRNAQVWFAERSNDADGSHPARAIALEATIVGGAVVRGHDGVATTSRFASWFDVIISGRPTFRAGRYYTVVAAGTLDFESTGANIQGTCILVDWTLTHTNLRPVVNVEPGLSVRLQIWSKLVTIDGNRWLYARQFIKAGSEQTETALYGASLVELDFASAERWGSTSHHGVTPIGAGVVGIWDGVDFTEMGFLASPRSPHVTTGAGSLTGSWRYVATYEDVDAAGNVVISGVSRPTALVTVTSGDIDLSLSDLATTYRTRTLGASGGVLQSRIRKVIYRSLTGGEPPFYRLGVATGNNFHDEISDAVLATRPKLYAPNLPGAVGEALDRRAPPQLLNLVSYAGMLVGTKGESLFWSGQEVYGEATWFSPVFELPVSGGGDFTGLKVQDGSLIAFKRDRIFMVAGQSPSDNGAQGGLGEPRLVSADWGCISADSIVVTQIGTFFQSERGIEIFSRAQTVEWIGEPILDTLERFPVVTSAVLDARNSLVRFTLAAARDANGIVVPYNPDANTDGGADVVFDLRSKTWISVDDRTDMVAAQHAAYVDVDGPRYAWLGSDGVVHVERDRGAELECRDDLAWVTGQYTTAPIRFGLLQDQRVFELMPNYQRFSSAGITIERAENYKPFGNGSDLADAVWTSAFLDANADNTRVALRAKESGYAVQLRLRDTPPAGTDDSGRGITWVGVSVDMGPKQGNERGTPTIAEAMRR